MNRSDTRADHRAPTPATGAVWVPRAVALAYARESGANAPRVRAKGEGAIAEEIIRRARAAGVFVHASPELVSLLMQVDLDRQIPPQMYQAIAGLLAWLYRIEDSLCPPSAHAVRPFS